MNIISNLIYGTDDKKEIETKEEPKIYVIAGIISSVEEWENYYVKINDKILILKRDNEKFNDLLKDLKVNDIISLNYIKDKNDNIITKISSEIYRSETIIKNLKTDLDGNTYITTSPVLCIENDESINIVLKRNYPLYHELYNKLDINKNTKLIMFVRKEQLQILDIREPINLSREITVIGSINIGKEVKVLNDFVEIIYMNHKKGLRFLISKSSNNLEEQKRYKIKYVKFHSDYFYNIISHELIL